MRFDVLSRIENVAMASATNAHESEGAHSTYRKWRSPSCTNALCIYIKRLQFTIVCFKRRTHSFKRNEVKRNIFNYWFRHGCISIFILKINWFIYLFKTSKECRIGIKISFVLYDKHIIFASTQPISNIFVSLSYSLSHW